MPDATGGHECSPSEGRTGFPGFSTRGDLGHATLRHARHPGQSIPECPDDRHTAAMGKHRLPARSNVPRMARWAPTCGPELAAVTISRRTGPNAKPAAALISTIAAQPAFRRFRVHLAYRVDFRPACDWQRGVDLSDYPDISLVDGVNLNVDIEPVDPREPWVWRQSVLPGRCMGQDKCNPTGSHRPALADV